MSSETKTYADVLVDAYYSIHPDEYPSGDHHRARQDAALLVAAKVLRDVMRTFPPADESPWPRRVQMWAHHRGIDLGDQ